MVYKIFLDTNIILDIFDSKRPFAEAAISLFLKIEQIELLAYFSESVVTTTDYILAKKFNTTERLEIINSLINHVKIIACNNAIIKNAIREANNDLEDSILYQLALNKELDYFISNDKNAKSKLSSKKLPIVTTKEFLKIATNKK